MNRFDLCIILNSKKYIEYVNAYAFILDMDNEPYYDVEIWNFTAFKGAKIDIINKKYLRPATAKEQEEFQEKWKKYIADME